MTPYAKLAREYREELQVVEQRLEKARKRARVSRDMDDDRKVAVLEQQRIELRVQIREFLKRAGEEAEI